MNLDKKGLIQVLSLNFGYKIINHSHFGDLIEFDSRTAYRFCLTTNSYYLNDVYGLRLFGRYVTFNHRNYSMLHGLFQLDKKNNISDNSLPYKLAEKNPFILKEKKKLLFIESRKSIDIIKKYHDEILNLDENPENYILNIVNPDGSQWEHYFEFMASEFFIRKGFLTDIQLPWNYHGRPDFGVYKHELLNLLRHEGFIESGALILELSALRFFTQISRKSDCGNIPYEFCVGEVKTNQKRSQILSYLETGICIKGYEFMQNKKINEGFCGLINISDRGEIKIIEGPNSEFYNLKKAQKDLEWFNNYLKIHLLGNLKLEEMRDLMKRKMASEKLTIDNMLKILEKISFEDILEEIKNGL